MTQDQAEVVALRALAWIAGDDDLLPQLASATGAGPDDFRDRAGDPAFLAGILGFLLTEDRWVKGFCDAEGLPYETPLRALAALPGGRHESWT